MIYMSPTTWYQGYKYEAHPTFAADNWSPNPPKLSLNFFERTSGGVIPQCWTSYKAW